MASPESMHGTAALLAASYDYCKSSLGEYKIVGNGEMKEESDMILGPQQESWMEKEEQESSFCNPSSSQHEEGPSHRQLLQKAGKTLHLK